LHLERGGGSFVLCTQVSLHQHEAPGIKSDSKLRHNTADPGDWLASLLLPLVMTRQRSSNAELSVLARSLAQSRQVGNVGEEALSPPLLQVYRHKVCRERAENEGDED